MLQNSQILNTDKKDSYSLSYTAQLMENIYPGKPVEYSKKMFTTHDADNNLLVFTLDNFDRLVLLQKAKNSTGYIETFIDEELPKSAKIINMAVAQGKNKKSTIIAVLVEEGSGNDQKLSIWHTVLKQEQITVIKEQQLNNLSSLTWSKKQVLKRKKIQDIAAGYRKDGKVQIAYSVIPEGGPGEDEYIYTYTGDGDIQAITIPEHPSSVLKIALGHDADLEDDDKDTHGLICVLYKVKTKDGNEESKMWATSYPKGNYNFEVPVKADTMTFSLAEKHGTSQVFFESSNKAYLYGEIFMHMKSNGDVKDRNDDVVEIAAFEKPIKELFPYYKKSTNALHTFVLLEEEREGTGGNIYMTKEEDSKWNEPVLHRSNVILMTANLQGNKEDNEVYFIEKNQTKKTYQLTVQRQGDIENDSIWHEQQITIDQQDRNDSYEYKSYSVNIKLNDIQNPQKPLDYNKEELKIKCSQNMTIKVNDVSIHTGDEKDIIGKFNSEGICLVEIPVSTINSPLLNFYSERVEGILQVDPAKEVKQKLDKMTSSSEMMKNAKVKNPNGSSGEYLIPKSSHNKVGAVCNAMNEMKKTIKIDNKDSSVTSLNDFNNKLDNIDNINNFELHFDHNEDTVTYKHITEEDLVSLYSTYSSSNWFRRSFGTVVNFFKKALKETVKKVSKVIVCVANKALKMIVKIGNFLWETTVKTIEQAWHVMESLLQDVLEVSSNAIMKFFSFLFPWEEIKRSKRAIRGIIDVSFQRILDELEGIRKEKKIESAFKHLSNLLFPDSEEDVVEKVKKRLGENADKNFKQMSDKYDSHYKKMETPQIAWSKNILQNSLSSGRFLQQSSFQFNNNLIKKIQNTLEKFTDEKIMKVKEHFEKVIKEISNDPNISIMSMIEKILKAVGITVLEVTGGAFQAVFELGVEVIKAVWSMLTEEYDLGWLGRVYKHVTGDQKLTILDAFCWLLSVPSVILTKVLQPHIRDVIPEEEVKIIHKFQQNKGKLEDLVKALQSRAGTLGKKSWVPTLLSSISLTINIFNTFIFIPASWYIKSQILSFIQFSLVTVNLTANIFNAAYGGYFEKKTKFFEGVFIALYGFSILILNAMKIILIHASQKVLSIPSIFIGLLSFVGSIGVFVGRFFEEEPDVPDSILQLFQNSSSSISFIVSGFIPLIVPSSDDAESQLSTSKENIDTAPEPVTVLKSMYVITVAMSNIGFLTRIIRNGVAMYR